MKFVENEMEMISEKCCYGLKYGITMNAQNPIEISYLKGFPSFLYIVSLRFKNLKQNNDTNTNDDDKMRVPP